MKPVLVPPARCQHFKDPFGLLARMLRSGSEDATFALARAALELLAVPVDALARPIERRALGKAAGPLLPIVQIVGPPRSGTTLVYQVLCNGLPYVYFDNLNSLFPRSPITAARVFRTNHQRPTGRTRSYYGNTAGARGTNDGFHVWDRWLGHDRIVYEPPTESAKDEMRRFFAAWFEHFPRPLLSKYNKAMLCMDMLADALPSTIFVAVARDPVFTAQSLLLAREKIQGDRRIGWGLGASTAGGPAANPDPIADVATQVRSLFAKLDEQLARVPADRVLRVRYDDFCKAPRRCADAVRRMVERRWPPGVNLRYPAFEQAGFASEDKVQIAAADFARLQALLADLRDEFAAGRAATLA